MKEEKKMLLLNIDHVPGRDMEAIGLVKGTVVQSKNFGKDFMAGMKTLVGGEITSYTDMLVEAPRSPPSGWWMKPPPWAPTPL